ncbi:MAG: hypothetical protein JNL96_10710 [Planctomycetaceae bacterium]|nr:hypothetical protein [Planctomycetaceae bacterium]
MLFASNFGGSPGLIVVVFIVPLLLLLLGLGVAGSFFRMSAFAKWLILGIAVVLALIGLWQP